MTKQTTNSAIAHNAHIGLTLVSINIDAIIADAYWISSEDNFIADGLSRGVAGKDLQLPEHLYIPVVEGDTIDQVIQATNPARSYDSAQSTLEFTKNIITLLRENHNLNPGYARG
jgi:hypothetical protein